MSQMRDLVGMRKRNECGKWGKATSRLDGKPFNIYCNDDVAHLRGEKHTYKNQNGFIYELFDMEV